MQTVRSFGDMATRLRENQLMALRLALANVELARRTLRPKAKPACGVWIVPETAAIEAARIARRPVDYDKSQRVVQNSEPALAGRVWNRSLRLWEKAPPTCYSNNKRPAQGYRPVSLPEGRQWRVCDNATGASLWLVQGTFNHARREADKAARSLGFGFNDFYIRLVKP